MGITARGFLGSGIAVVLLWSGAGASAASVALPEGDPVLLLGQPVDPVGDAAPVPEGAGQAASGPARAQQLSPARCSGRTDYPHKSGTSVSVHASMSCSRTVSRVETATTIYRDRWYGPELVVAGTATRSNASTSGTATPHKSCKGTGTFSYRAYSAHASLEGGTIYRANTSNWQIPGKSQFAC